MVYRRCDTHGWFETSEHSVNAHSGETICPICGMAVSGARDVRPPSYEWRGDVPRIFGSTGSLDTCRLPDAKYGPDETHDSSEIEAALDEHGAALIDGLSARDLKVVKSSDGEFSIAEA